MILSGTRIFLRPFEEFDADKLTRLITRNKTFWGKTEPEWQSGYYTLEGQMQNIKYFRDGFQKGTFFTFGVYEKGTHTLLGIINLYDIKRGPFQSAVIGYSMDKDQTGKGLASESLRLVLAFAFDDLHLNRISAEVMPRNFPSVRVLEKAGFQKEGFARETICIKGRWENHLQYSILRREWVLEQA